MVSLKQELSQKSVIRASKQPLSSEIAEETIILDMKSGTYFGLNETGTQIWKWLQEPKTIKDVQSLIMEEYEVEEEQCDRDLQAILQEMLAAGLIEVVDEKAT